MTSRGIAIGDTLRYVNPLSDNAREGVVVCRLARSWLVARPDGSEDTVWDGWDIEIVEEKANVVDTTIDAIRRGGPDGL